MKKRAHIPHNFDISFSTGQAYVRGCVSTIGECVKKRRLYGSSRVHGSLPVCPYFRLECGTILSYTSSRITFGPL